eukprot:g4198.t1
MIASSSALLLTLPAMVENLDAFHRLAWERALADLLRRSVSISDATWHDVLRRANSVTLAPASTASVAGSSTSGSSSAAALIVGGLIAAAAPDLALVPDATRQLLAARTTAAKALLREPAANNLRVRPGMGAVCLAMRDRDIPVGIICEGWPKAVAAAILRRTMAGAEGMPADRPTTLFRAALCEEDLAAAAAANSSHRNVFSAMASHLKLAAGPEGAAAVVARSGAAAAIRPPTMSAAEDPE